MDALEKRFGQSVASMNQMAVNQQKFQESMVSAQNNLIMALQQKHGYSPAEATEALDGQLNNLDQIVQQQTSSVSQLAQQGSKT